MRILELFDVVATIQNFQKTLGEAVTPIMDLYRLADVEIFELRAELECEYHRLLTEKE